MVSGGQISDLANFDGTSGPGTNPYEGVVKSSDGNLYGTTAYGGTGYNGASRSGFGTVFSLNLASRDLTTLVKFNGTDGQAPDPSVIRDDMGDLIGTVAGGNAYGDGAVFEIKTGSNNITTLATFSGAADGREPVGPVIEDANMNLFGTTYKGGPNDDGTVFEIPYTTFTQIAVPAVTYDADAQITVTVASEFGSATPTGAVSLSVDGGTPESLPLVNGTSTFTVTGLHAGNHTLNAKYTAQGGFPASSSAGTLTVNPFSFTHTIPNDSKTYGGPAADLTADLPAVIDTGLNGEILYISFTPARATHPAPLPAPTRSSAHTRTAPGCWLITR